MVPLDEGGDTTDEIAEEPLMGIGAVGDGGEFIADRAKSVVVAEAVVRDGELCQHANAQLPIGLFGGLGEELCRAGNRACGLFKDAD
jgi:hypothetical protein